MNQPEKCKYTPLENYFRLLSVTRRKLTLTFEQIQDVLQSALPKSAYERLTWWDNTVQGTISHKNAWLHAGWLVDKVDLPGRKVDFVLNGDKGRIP